MKYLSKIIIVLLFSFILVSCNKTEVLRVGMDLSYPPFETVNKNNQPEGISVDVSKELGKFLNREVKIINTSFKGLILALQSGEVDVIISSMSITEERSLSVDFSKPYFYFKIITLLNKEFALTNNLTEDSKLEDLLAIKDARYTGIAAQVSASIPKDFGKEVKEKSDLLSATEEIVQGNADVLLMSANPVTAAHKANKDKTMILWDPFVSSPIGMAVKKGNEDLLKQINLFIDSAKDKNGLYEMLKIKWDNEILEDLGRYGLDFYVEE